MNREIRWIASAFLLLVVCSPAWAGIAPARVDGVAAAASGDDLLLNWSAATTDLYGNALTISQYNVYRGTTPGFVPDFVSGSNRIAQPGGNTYTDSGALNALDSYYYRITAVSSDGDESLVASSVAHKIRRALIFDAATANRHWLSLPANSAWSSASDIGNSAANIARVIRWDAASRMEQLWDVSASTGSDFPVTAGEAYAVEISADTTFNLIGVASTSALALALAYNAGDFNHHWVSVPQPNAYGAASTLADQLTDVTKIATYNNSSASYQSWFQLDGQWMGDDFALTPGMGVVVSISAATQWQPATGAPGAQAQSTPNQGYETITVELSGIVTDVTGSIVSYQWDFEGDGTFDFSSDTTADAGHTYTALGTYHPTLLVTDDRGQHALAYATLTVTTLNVDFSMDGFLPLEGEVTGIGFDLPAAGTLTLLIYDEQGNLVRALVSDAAESAGAKTYEWDGTDGAGQIVTNGSYYVVIQYTVAGHTSIYDTRETSGGIDITGGLTGVAITNTLSPLTGEYVNIDYTLPENALVSIRIEDQSGTLIRTLLDAAPRAAGSHEEIWDGSSDDGQPVAPGTAFNVSISSTSLASNSLIAQGSEPRMSNLSATPLRFSPAINPYGSQESRRVTIAFNLNKQADLITTVFDSNGTVVFTETVPDLVRGDHSVIWGGRNQENVLMAAGNYTVRLRAEDETGGVSQPFNVLTEVFY